ncbi:MAG: hypothetical protein ABL858_03170 [Candidatus Nitrotoga sp.]
MAALFVNTACASRTGEDAMQIFVEQTNMTISRKTNIDAYLKPRSGVTLEGVQEVQPGVMEYSFVDKLKLFVPAEKKCRFIVVVQKDTGAMTSWRYNSKPEYCTSNR